MYETLPLITFFRTLELNLCTQDSSSRLSRIRDNQRRSRARKREYIEDLEGRWKKCQDLGVQANVELQKAAQKVIEENILLRKILGELGLETAHVDKRVQELKVTAIAEGNDFNICSGDHGYGEITGSGLDGVGQGMAASLDSAQSLEQPSEAAGVGSRQDNFGEGSVTDLDNPSSMDADIPQPNINSSSLLSAFHDPIFDTSILEGVPDQESPFDIAQFLEPVMHLSLEYPAPAPCY